MSIKDWVGKIKSPEEVISFDREGRVERYPWLQGLYLSLIIIMVGTLSFGLGRISAPQDREPLEIRYDESLTANVLNSGKPAPLEAVSPATVGSNGVVASSKSTKYHYSHCPGAKQISEANKITFASASDAESAGYVLAGNCSPR